ASQAIDAPKADTGEVFNGYGDSDVDIAGSVTFAAAAWVRMSERLPEKDEGDEVTVEEQNLLMNGTEIVASVYTGSGWTSQRLTTNATPDLAPGHTPDQPRPTPGQTPAANPFRVTPRPYMARRTAPALKMPASIFTYTFVFPRRCIFSTVGSRRLFGDRSAGRGMASPDRPTARPSRGNRAGGGNVQEKDALRGAQDTKEDAYGDDERGA
ncbi:MAG TPA: hypothetical protein IAB20_08565, partial [Candidatus Pullichristensenella excrementipullorum]|nr:hypothetical protein [Candidatus Pullichristensenella excrementipullorum]